MTLDLLSRKALAGEVEHGYCHEAEADFWVGVHDTACYDNGHTVHSAVPATWNSLGATTMAEKRSYYLTNLGGHVATPSQQDVWKGLSILKGPLKQRQMFNRPTELDPSLSKLRSLIGTTVPPFDPSDQEPKEVRRFFLAVRQFAEKEFPSLLSKTSTSFS